MATLGQSSQSTAQRPTRKSCARKCERCCCSTVIYLPLLIIYGLTTWAVWVQVSIGLLPGGHAWTGRVSALAGLILYVLLNWSYTVAVFTDPGSSSRLFGAKNTLPTHEIPAHTSLTAKYNGEVRYCKKCQARKPDRAHHCSTCRRCVLQMDHHCPWLATCVGFRNRKPFLLFLIYTCFFCWMSFAVGATWVWSELVTAGFQDQLMPVNFILLAVIGGIIGLVMSGFTGWHIWLACSGQTTIESLEKTRYLTPLRRSMQQQFQRNQIKNQGPSFGEQLREIHANAIPGVTRLEEGEERGSPARESLRQNYADAEYQRESQRYYDYLDEQDSEKLPHAFDLGWRRNLRQLFGDKPLYWMLPVCNSTGDGWRWESSTKWHEAQRQLTTTRQARLREQQIRDQDRENTNQIGPNMDFRRDQAPNVNPRTSSLSTGHISMQTLDLEQADDSSSDDESQSLGERSKFLKQPLATTTSNWNDIPEDLLRPQSGQGVRVPSRQRRRGEAG